MISEEEFEQFITQLKARAFSDEGVEIGFLKIVDKLVCEVKHENDGVKR